GGEGLALHEVAVHLEHPEQVRIALHGELDAVGDLEAGGAPGLLHVPDEVPRASLELELGGQVRREEHEAAGGHESERLAVAAPGPLEHELVLALEQL